MNSNCLCGQFKKQYMPDNIQVTTNDIMEFLQTNMVMKSDFDERLEQVDKRLENLEERVGSLENQMVTKDYLDNKLADLGAEIGRRINQQIEREIKFKQKLIQIFRSKSFIDEQELKQLEELV